MSYKSFNVTENPKYNGYQISLALIVYKFFDTKSAFLAWLESLATRDKSASGSGIKIKNISNKELGEELH